MENSYGYWIPLDTKPSSYMSDGLVKPGDLVEIPYKLHAYKGVASVVGSKIEDKKVFTAKKVGITYFLSAV